MTRQEQFAFIEKIAPLARTSQEKYGVPASVTIAQAILESAWGKSVLTCSANNYFGIKCYHVSDPSAHYATFRTEEFSGGITAAINADFMVFLSPAACFDCHARLLANAPRYRPAMADARDPLEFAARLQDCGYSTDPLYAKKLVQVITEFSLLNFDADETSAAVNG